MKNGIVVLNIPRKCNECRFCTIGFSKCMLKTEDGYIKSIDTTLDEKPDWCPIKRIPEKKDDRDIEFDYTEALEKTIENRGWNACIDEILK